MDHRVRLLVATWIVENGVSRLLSSHVGPSPIDIEREIVRKAIVLTASHILLRGTPIDLGMGTKPGQTEPWEELELCEDTRL